MEYKTKTNIEYKVKTNNVKNKTSMTEPEKVKAILELLDTHYSKERVCYLDHGNAWQLLVATILSQQCTDNRVNAVTKELFAKYGSIGAFADADLRELEQDVLTTGLYHNKAANIIGCCKMLMDEYGGEVPRGIEDLTRLPGVGRKTANVVRGHIFHDECIVVDTHVKRISKRLGLTRADDPVRIEYELMDKLPKDHWISYNLQVIAHGRSICMARNPKCGSCLLHGYCIEASFAWRGI